MLSPSYVTTTITVDYFTENRIVKIFSVACVRCARGLVWAWSCTLRMNLRDWLHGSRVNVYLMVDIRVQMV